MGEHVRMSMRALYTRYAASHPTDGALGAVVDLLADGALTHERFLAVVRQYRVEESRRFRDGLLDLVLYAVGAALRDHFLGSDDAALIRELTVLFGIREGDVYRRRRGEVVSLLQQEVHRILEDDYVDRGEALHQEALQRIFGLGYDQYLELIRDAVTPLVERAIAAAAADGEVTPEERARLERQLADLRTVYVLTYQQRRALGLR